MVLWAWVRWQFVLRRGLGSFNDARMHIAWKHMRSLDVPYHEMAQGGIE